MAKNGGNASSNPTCAKGKGEQTGASSQAEPGPKGRDGG